MTLPNPHQEHEERVTAVARLREWAHDCEVARDFDQAAEHRRLATAVEDTEGRLESLGDAVAEIREVLEAAGDGDERIAFIDDAVRSLAGRKQRAEARAEQAEARVRELEERLGTIRERLRDLRRNDKTPPYDYKASSIEECDYLNGAGEEPEPGERWLTPSEIAESTGRQIDYWLKHPTTDVPSESVAKSGNDGLHVVTEEASEGSGASARSAAPPTPVDQSDSDAEWLRGFSREVQAGALTLERLTTIATRIEELERFRRNAPATESRFAPDNTGPYSAEPAVWEMLDHQSAFGLSVERLGEIRDLLAETVEDTRWCIEHPGVMDKTPEQTKGYLPELRPDPQISDPDSSLPSVEGNQGSLTSCPSCGSDDPERCLACDGIHNHTEVYPQYIFCCCNSFHKGKFTPSPDPVPDTRTERPRNCPTCGRPPHLGEYRSSTYSRCGNADFHSEAHPVPDQLERGERWTVARHGTDSRVIGSVTVATEAEAVDLIKLATGHPMGGFVAGSSLPSPWIGHVGYDNGEAVLRETIVATRSPSTPEEGTGS